MDNFTYGEFGEGSGLETVLGVESDYFYNLDYVEGSGLELARNMGQILDKKKLTNLFVYVFIHIH